MDLKAFKEESKAIKKEHRAYAQTTKNMKDEARKQDRQEAKALKESMEAF